MTDDQNNNLGPDDRSSNDSNRPGLKMDNLAFPLTIGINPHPLNKDAGAYPANITLHADGSIEGEKSEFLRLVKEVVPDRNMAITICLWLIAREVKRELEGDHKECPVCGI